MRLPPLLVCAALLCGCPSPVPEDDPGDPLTPTEEGPLDPVETTASSSAPPSVAGERATRAASLTDEQLASLLRPYEGPLPSRDFLEGAFEDPVATLLRLTTADWVDPLARSNAYRELGHFHESGLAVSRLLEVAVDSTAVRTDRVGAIEGLARPGVLVDAHVERLLPLLADPDPMLQAASVRLLAPWPAARPAVRSLADAPDTHVDVRRFARRALESTNEER